MLITECKNKPGEHVFLADCLTVFWYLQLRGKLNYHHWLEVQCLFLFGEQSGKGEGTRRRVDVIPMLSAVCSLEGAAVFLEKKFLQK